MPTKTIPVILDTSIYKQSPKLNSQLFEELVRYQNIGKFQLYIPEIIENEYLTWIKRETQSALESTAKATNVLKKLSDSISMFDFVAFASNSEIERTLKSTRENWEKFKLRTKAIELPILGEHGKIVMDAYFSGQPPFKEEKSRQDIPDAFIYYAMIDLLEHNEKIIFVAQDKNFINRISNKRIETYDNLATLYGSSEYKLSKEFFDSVTPEKRQYNILRYYLHEIKRKVARSIEMTDFVTVIERGMGEYAIGCFDETITDAHSVNLDIDRARTLSDSSCLIPFRATLSCTIKSTGDRDDLDKIPNERKNGIEKEMNEDGDYNLSEIVMLSIEGNASVSFEDGNPLEWKKVDPQPIYDFMNPGIKEINTDIENINEST